MELAIESVGEQSSVAISDAGLLLAEITWVSGRRHTPSLVPMIDRVSALADPNGEAHSTRDALKTVIVDVGPGAYGGIRAGMAAAMGLAVALDLDCVGVGRLEIQTYAHAAAGAATAIHRASRGAWVWQSFAGSPSAWAPTSEPTLGTIDELLDQLSTDQRRGVVCGDTDLLDESQRERLAASNLVVGGAALNVRRASLLAELGYQRWLRGEAVAPGALEPLYLREPAIGPQPPPALPKNEG